MGRGRARSQGSLPGRHTMPPYIGIQRNATPTTCASLLAKFDGDWTTVATYTRRIILTLTTKQTKAVQQLGVRPPVRQLRRVGQLRL